MTIAEVALPEPETQSRIHRAPKSESPDDFTTAAERIAAFWEKYPDGSILPEVEVATIAHASHIPYRVYTVRAFIRKDSQSERPDAVAHATRGENDEDEQTRQFPQETAETSAISRAIRNLGILVGPKTPVAAATTVPVEKGHPLAVARLAAKMSQRKLAESMQGKGFDWSQSLVSKVEGGSRPLNGDEILALTELIGFKST
ncbi:helix-turn-helix transcriptional regulator [Microbacterium sp. K24]|uniref:helix-turn-helix domain-containing protein n=1 Tax=Microbacterium sp. K24 TaxID=2305446 RepID=UPI00109C94E2|nr:helix-turn-helix transcriptional regulator [Microbacterium sp. K24]